MAGMFNILLITTDSQRTDTLGCMGAPFAYSPHLDALARRGVLFTQAHSASPVCMPARCSIMTGLHAPLHGCTENGLRRRGDLPLFTDALKELGYTNIMAGKTHFGPLPSSFDYQYLVKGEKGGDSDDCFAEEMRRRGYSRASSHPNPVPEEYCLDSLIVDKTIEAVSAVKKTGKPFFAFCSLLSPHSPLDPPGRWLTEDLFKEPIPPPDFERNEWEKLPPGLKKICGIPNPNQGQMGKEERLLEARGNVADNLCREEMMDYRELYYRSAAYCDSLVGRLTGFLDDSGLRKNTLVIFSSDHGIQNFDHGFNDKHNYYDESLRVPFIMSLPGVLPEHESRGFASHVDLASTITAAAGGNRGFGGGFDLFTPLSRGEGSPRRCAVSALYGSLALVTERWKLEYYYHDNRFRLFDRIGDAGEKRDLGEDPEYAPVRNALARALLMWRTGLIDTEALKKMTGPGGPVAMRVIDDVLCRNPWENEERLDTLIRETGL